MLPAESGPWISQGTLGTQDPMARPGKSLMAREWASVHILSREPLGPSFPGKWLIRPPLGLRFRRETTVG